MSLQYMHLQHIPRAHFLTSSSMRSTIFKFQIYLLANTRDVVSVMPADVLAAKPTGHQQA